VKKVQTEIKSKYQADTGTGIALPRAKQ
jgi:hypothetical protein